jgi:hypothetical protein
VPLRPLTRVLNQSSLRSDDDCRLLATLSLLVHHFLSRTPFIPEGTHRTPGYWTLNILPSFFSLHPSSFILLASFHLQTYQPLCCKPLPPYLQIMSSQSTTPRRHPILVQLLLSLLFVCVFTTLPFAQRNLVSSFYTKSNVTDSSVSVSNYDLKKGEWEPTHSYTDTYHYKDHRLVSAVIHDQEYLVHFKRNHIAITVLDKGKKSSAYKYVFDHTRKVSHADHYIFEKNKESYWGVEHFSYDSSGRLSSANYVVLNERSMHPGYEHNCTYVYDSFGRIVMELRGYRKTEYFYNEKNELDYCLGEDNEFGKRQFKMVYSTIVK